MTRLILYIALSLVITAAITWLASLTGTITIDVAGYRLQPSVGASAVALTFTILIAIAIWAILRRIIEAPKNLARVARQRRKDLGVTALSDGFIALQAGNPQKARTLAREAQSRLPTNAAAQLLEARADLALGDLGPAREHYRALISNPKTALAALSGLYEQARAQNRNDIALTFARKANDLTKGVDWAERAVFDDLTASGDWAAALQMITTQSTPARRNRPDHRRTRAVLHTALAAADEALDPASALNHAQSALKLQPEFVPAALISARTHINRGETRKAQALLRRVWRQTGHPHIATLFANAQPGTSTTERLKRTSDLLGGNPQGRDAAMVLARAAIDAYEWSSARNALATYSSADPTQGVCLLMAEIEEGQNGDQGKAREWLARAVRAPRDPVWVADGIIANEWEPTSPATGKLDRFEWRVPVSTLAPVANAAVEKIAAPEPLPAPALPATTQQNDN